MFAVVCQLAMARTALLAGTPAGAAVLLVLLLK
jgi:hypothetical protein